MRAINTFFTLKILANCQMSTGSLMTRQTYDRAPRLTNWPLHTFQRVLMENRIREVVFLFDARYIVFFMRNMTLYDLMYG